jgi:tetratricopeptide (TPR) repeat protein
VPAPGGLEAGTQGEDMLVPSLITLVVVLSAVILYVYVIAPRLNPLNRADSYLRQNMVDEAILEYKKSLDANPNDFMVHWKLANVLFDQDQVDEAVIHLEEILRIDKYNYEVEKAKVQRKLAEVYMRRDEVAKAFQNYYDLLKAYPGDAEALYHAGFILLGQEYFEQALRCFERLIKLEDRDFEVLFGAGIASYQIMKVSEPVEYFRDALALDTRSDITNLAMAFALQRKNDYKTALNYARLILDGTGDETARFVATRLYGILCVQAKKPAEGAKMLEMILEYARKNDMAGEVSVLLYDLGFASLHAEMAEQAYEYWNQLYQIDKNFRNIQFLVTQLRREMDAAGRTGARPEGGVLDHDQEWFDTAFAPDFLWNICGLKSAKAVDLDPILASARAETGREEDARGKMASGDQWDGKLGDFYSMDMENFRIIAGRVVGKLGLRVDEILSTYREPDGVDFLATDNATKDKTLVWVRRWKDLRISEIPLRNLAQAVNDLKAKQGVFITTTELSAAGEEAVKRLPKVRVVFPSELGSILAGLI